MQATGFMQATGSAGLYIIGAGGHGREVYAYVQDLRGAGWKDVLQGFLDDGLAAGTYGRLEVLGPMDSLPVHTNSPRRYLTACGSNPVRRAIVERLTAFYGENLAPWTLVHPSVYVGQDIDLGVGTCIAPGAILTTRTRIGSHCIVNVKASVSHDCVIGDFVNINPGVTICGSVTIGDGANIGAGAVVKERVSIGAWSTIGAGAVVIRDIPPNVTAVGVTARIIKTA